MASENQIFEAAEMVFSFDIHLYICGRLWHEKDFHDLTEYEVLLVASLLYILSDEEKRTRITDALRENLGIKDPENAVRYVILHDLSSVSSAKMLFHRISYTSELILKNTASEDLAKKLPALYLTAAEIYLVSTIAVSFSEMSVNLASLTLRLWLDCQVNNLRNAGRGCDPFHDYMTWPSLEEFFHIIQENELEFGPYEPMGDPKLDQAAEPIFEYFRDMVTDGFARVAKESKNPGFYVPFKEPDYAAALERYRYIMKYMERYGTYTDEYRQDEESLSGVINRMFAMADELEPLMKDVAPKSSVTIRDGVRMSMLNVFLYLTASDEYVSGKEVRLINDCLGYEFTKDEIKRLIRDQNIYTVTFENQTPPAMKLLMKFDRALAKRGYAVSVSYTRRFVTLCEEAGRLFLGCDGSANDDEKRDLQTLISKYSTLAEKLERNMKKICRKG